ncbi:hypothetical protein QZH41_005253 [Actinostola sp. cb2023]|nr:hypothetical protein QZH41_005253 [Actinostola sp. cb2023]
MSLVMALHEYKEGLVKEEAAFTLAAFSKGSSAVGKPRGTVTQKKKRQRRSGNDDDIWDHVLHKWQSQDKVAKLLKKFNVKY